MDSREWRSPDAGMPKALIAAPIKEVCCACWMAVAAAATPSGYAISSRLWQRRRTFSQIFNDHNGMG